MRSADPYAILGVDPGAEDAVVRRAYRHLVQLHHPDHNPGSPEAARRFEEIHAAYLEVLRRRAAAAGLRSPAQEAQLSARLAALEQELNAARRTRERLARRPRGRRGSKPAPRAVDASLARLSALVEGLDALASQLDDVV